MKEHNCPVLCGGTFFTLLLQAKKPRSSIRNYYKSERDGFSESDVFVGLIKIFSPSYEKPKKTKSFSPITSDYKICNPKRSKSEYLVFSDTAKIDIFDNLIRTNYRTSLDAMLYFVNDFIDTHVESGMTEWLAKSLIELIETDKSIDNEQMFYVCQNGQPLSKFELCKLSDICLPALLLGIWHFIICSKIDNKRGADTYNSWHIKPKEKRARHKFVGKTGETITHQIKVSLEIAIDSEKSSKDISSISETNENSYPNLPMEDASFEKKDNEVLKAENSILNNTKEEISFERIPEIFVQGLEDYSITGFILQFRGCEPVHSYKVVDFVKYIRCKILCKFVSRTKEDIYVDIKEFTIALENYNTLLEVIDISILEEYTRLLWCYGLNDIISTIGKDRNELIEEKNKIIPEPKEVIN